MYDLLIKGGQVLDPGQNLKGRLDIAIAGVKFAKIQADIDPKDATRIVNVSDKIVTPGLIDLHTHVYHGIGTLGINDMGLSPDLAGVHSGVTTLVDAGSSGVLTLGGFLNYVLPHAKTRIIVFLHAGVNGLLRSPEIRTSDDIDVEASVKAIQAHKHVVRGVKVRMVSPALDTLGIELPKLAKRIAKEAGVRLMVHIGDVPKENPKAARLTRQLLAEVFEPGDILTHLYTFHVGGVLDEARRAIKEVQQAQRAGVTLDPAHGRGNFSFNVARTLLDQDIVPDTISTDITSPGRQTMVHSLTESMSKFLALGMSLEDLILRTTSNPAKALGMYDSIGAIAVGREADLTVLDLVEGDWEFRDAENKTLRGQKALVPVLTVRAGQVIPVDWGPRPWGWLPAKAA